MPTFCQGWGMLPFDQSSTDITAHAIRAFQAWRKSGRLKSPECVALKRKMLRAEERMFAFLERTQQKNGSWHPLWFGNQFMPDEANPIYGTAKVLLALVETQKESAMTTKGLRYLVASQNTDGGWGRDSSNTSSSIEETAVVVEALAEYARTAGASHPVLQAYHRGLNWLLEAVESDRFLETSPIGLYFAKLWYYEDLYPVIFTASALRRALSLQVSE
jgi:squalene-hopene/tetraprenyl-beta-curcumene cyclase